MVDRPFVLDGLVAAAERRRLIDALETLPSHTLVGPMRSVGTMLAPTEAWPSGPPLDLHAAACAAVDAVLATTLPDLEPRIRAALAEIHGVPVDRLGPGYGFATMRTLPPGSAAPAHNDRYRPEGAWAAREASLDDERRWSWYLVLQAPESGGELRLEDGLCVAAPAGALLTFCASAFVHEVRRVDGALARITLGGFGGLRGGELRLWA